MVHVPVERCVRVASQQRDEHVGFFLCFICPSLTHSRGSLCLGPMRPQRVSTTVNMTRKRNDVLILRGEKQEQTLESVHHPDTERERSPHSSLHLQNTLTPELCVRQTWSQYAKAVRVIPSPWKCLDVWQKQNEL